MPKPLARVHPRDREAWRAWLVRNHETSPGVWLVFWKKSTGKPILEYEHSVEEALCFGWIDGLKHAIDEQRYAYRFTPRKMSSRWSPSNLARARRLIDAGRMQAPGLALAKAALAEAHKRPESSKKRAEEFPADFRAALAASSVARSNFDSFAPGYRRRYLMWIVDAKRPETRAKRIREAVRLIAQNIKVLMK